MQRVFPVCVAGASMPKGMSMDMPFGGRRLGGLQACACA